MACLTAEPLCVDACLRAVGDPSAGGIGCFVGVVRDHDHGKPVASLTYEAHPSAARRLQQVCDEALSPGVIAVAASHRTGSLEIGDLAVVVTVSAAHRDVALRVAATLIDAIKDSVPIWKHQRFADGTTEWVGCG